MQVSADGELLSYLTGQADEAEARQRTLIARLKLMAAGAVPVAQAPFPREIEDREGGPQQQQQRQSQPKSKSKQQTQQRSSSDARSRRVLGSACLQCRGSHDRCDPGEAPDSVCVLCERRGLTCSFVIPA